MRKELQTVMVLTIVLTVVMVGFHIVEPEALITKFLSVIWLCMATVIVVYHMHDPAYVVYNMCGVIYCGPTTELPEEATDIAYFSDFDEATAYCNELAERQSFEDADKYRLEGW